jgi:protein tyrosine/serine phosphatase
MRLRLVILVLALTGGLSASTAPRTRPAEWAPPLIETSLENVYRVSNDLYRCEQPTTRDIADLKTLGVHTLLNLRRYHTDSKEFAAAGFTLLANPIDAGDVTEDYLVATLRQFRAAPKPVVVHCWHGSDRTGVFVAAYRIVFDGWTREAAIDEFRHGGYGFHEKWYPNLIALLEKLDAEKLRQRVLQ